MNAMDKRMNVKKEKRKNKRKIVRFETQMEFNEWDFITQHPWLSNAEQITGIVRSIAD